MPKIMPCLWIDDRIEAAANYYVKLFDGTLHSFNRPGGPGTPPLTALFRLKDQEFMMLNGGPRFPFTEAVSFTIDCVDQAEVDYFWDNMIADGGKESMCGWLSDQFGLSWQIVPQALGRTLGGSDPAGAQRAMQAMLKMRKLVVADLERAYAGT